MKVKQDKSSITHKKALLQFFASYVLRMNLMVWRLLRRRTHRIRGRRRKKKKLEEEEDDVVGGKKKHKDLVPVVNFSRKAI